MLVRRLLLVQVLGMVLVDGKKKKSAELVIFLFLIRWK